MHSFYKIVITTLFITTLFACKTASVKYTLDPEFNYLQESLQGAQIVAVTVIDNRQPQSGGGVIALPETDDVAKSLQRLLINKLKEKGYKIISKPLLADIAYDLVINELILTVDKGMLKSSLKGRSKISLTLSKHSKSMTKSFSTTRTQDVANPVSNLDATGVINQMLSKLFSNMFSDQSLSEFSAKSD